MESTWSPHRVYMESITQLSKYALSYVLCGLYVDSMWTLVESIWSYGVHMESMGQGKVHVQGRTLPCPTYFRWTPPGL
jgi:hypothetical protein